MRRVAVAVSCVLALVATNGRSADARQRNARPPAPPAFVTSGTLSTPLFNGRIRVRDMRFRLPTRGDAMGVALDRRLVVFTVRVHNLTREERVAVLRARLVDSDGIMVTSYDADPIEGEYALVAGASARQSFRFAIPAGFAPVSILIRDSFGAAEPAFRVWLSRGDLPA